QVAFQKVMDLAVNAIGHLISPPCTASILTPSGRHLTANWLSGVEHMHRFDIPRVKRSLKT
ncbi:MAG: hypothetical protein WBW73_21725, partial [Rhodoplanes sp.]